MIRYGRYLPFTVSLSPFPILAVTVVYVPLYGLQKKKYSTAYPKWFNPLLLEDQLAGEERIEVGLGLVAGNGGRQL